MEHLTCRVVRAASAHSSSRPPRRAASSWTFSSLEDHQGEHEAKEGRGSAGTPPSCEKLLRRSACLPTPSEGPRGSSEGEGSTPGKLQGVLAVVAP